MGMEVDTDADITLAFTSWVTEAGIWDGRECTWDDAPEFLSETEEKIHRLLTEDNPRFFELAIQLAHAGTDAESRVLLEKEILELKVTENGVVPAGFSKKLAHFWKKHKVAILIGVGVVAIVATIVIVTVCTSAAVASAAAAASALDEANKNTEPKTSTAKPKPIEWRPDGVVVNGEPLTYAEIRAEVAQSAPISKETPWYQKFFQPHIIPDNSSYEPPPNFASINRYFAQYEKALEQSSSPRIQYPLDFPICGPDGTVPMQQLIQSRGTPIDRSNLDPISPHSPGPSFSYSVGQSPNPTVRIGGINGLANHLTDALSNTAYLHSFAPDQKVDWVYNRTHSAPVDLLEVFASNYLGHSHNTAKLLQENWQAFHQENKDNPHEKYLQFCHSQGAIHVKNALLDTPKEICDRVIVVAIAPAAVVPRELCFRSFNYASKRDIVPVGELVVAGMLDTNEFTTSKGLEMILENHKQLIRLEPHPNAIGIDHDFQSETFKRVISDHIDDYVQNAEKL
jgi:hypothetical protein